MKMQSIRMIATALLFLALATTPAMAQHVVALYWTASSTSGATYNIYRQQACSGIFEKINTTAVATTTYNDAAVAPGETYCYQVTSVSGGLESSPTNPAPGTIPAASVSPSSPQSPGRSSCTRRSSFLAWAKCVAALPRKSN